MKNVRAIDVVEQIELHKIETDDNEIKAIYWTIHHELRKLYKFHSYYVTDKAIDDAIKSGLVQWIDEYLIKVPIDSEKKIDKDITLPEIINVPWYKKIINFIKNIT